MISKPPLGRHPTVPRRVLTLACAALLSIFLLPAVVAQADTSSTLTVVGTSDVSDSGLMPTLIQPEFHAAYPQFTFSYTGTNTFHAVQLAETGTGGGPSVLIVHAAAIENQFVANGYSYGNQYGYAIFRNDFVLAGSVVDPAGVSVNAPNNIVQAFEDVATKGYNGGGTPLASFVARDSGSGTSVAEHAIWALVGQQPTQPPGLLLCTVPAAIGAGETPIAPGHGVTTDGQACPGGGNDGLPPNADFPAWYIGTTLDQGPTVLAANACTFASPANSCYVFTDRGTFDYLSSGLDPAGTIPNLSILVRNNSSTAPGGADQLINYFHAYIINPSAPCNGCETVNLTAAKDFVAFLTSPYLQSQLSSYQDGSPPDNDGAGAPFVADASPIITEAGIPTSDPAGKAVTVTGSVTNAEPGYPVLAGKTVEVDEIEAGIPVAIASGTTSSTGTYSVKFVPPADGLYQVSTPQISQVENTTLSPQYGDILSPGASASVQLTGLPSSRAVSFSKVTVKKGKLKVTGTLKPPPSAKGAKVELLALRGTGGKLKEIAHTSVGVSKSTFTIKTKLKRGSRWFLQLEYVQKGQTSTYSKLSSILVH
jgi:ABC-type tungstate transport system permease subunit